MYAKHISETYESIVASLNSVPKDNNLSTWLSFFDRVLKPKIESIGGSCVAKIGAYNYTYLQIGPKEISAEDLWFVPYLEIQSRDCCNNKFKARILRYYDYKNDDNRHIKEKDLNDLKHAQNLITNNGKVFKVCGTEKMNKQVGKTETYSINSSNAFDFENSIICKVIREYLELFKNYHFANLD